MRPAEFTSRWRLNNAVRDDLQCSKKRSSEIDAPVAAVRMVRKDKLGAVAHDRYHGIKDNADI
jgi:hypothetical protein